jgi:3-hydroxybutyryl-CoA dehydrogenase
MTADAGCVVVVGAGTMGAGIAQVAAAAGYDTLLCDVDAEVVARARARIVASLESRVAQGKLADEAFRATIDRLTPLSDLRAAAARADFVIEAVPENMDLKVAVLATAVAAAPAGAILASNTSSLSITELGARLGTGERTIGAHFFNPPPAMPLLELVRGLHTSEATLSRCRAAASSPTASASKPSWSTIRPASPRAASAWRSAPKRSACSRAASRRWRTSIAPWSSATATRWAR